MGWGGGLDTNNLVTPTRIWLSWAVTMIKKGLFPMIGEVPSAESPRRSRQQSLCEREMNQKTISDDQGVWKGVGWTRF